MKVYILIKQPDAEYAVDNSYRMENNEHPLGDIVGVYLDRSKADKLLEEMYKSDKREIRSLEISPNDPKWLNIVKMDGSVETMFGSLML